MRFIPTIPVGVGDQKLIQLFTGILKNLANVLDCSVYTSEVVWKVPFDLQVPTAGNIPRLTSPEIVRLARVVPVLSPDDVVHFGATTWKWQGANTVRITDQDGLVESVKYRLTFEVVG